MNNDNATYHRALQRLHTNQPPITAADLPAMYDMVQQMREHYPLFTLPATLLLHHASHLLTPEQLKPLLTYLASTCIDSQATYNLADVALQDWGHIYPAEQRPEQISTDNAIDLFLETYGKTSPQEDALLEKLIFNPTPDYSQVLMQQEQTDDPTPATHDSQDDRINAFIGAHPTATPKAIKNDEPQPKAQTIDKPSKKTTTQPSAKATTLPDDTTLSESLAKIFIKQGRYDRAFEIISNINLNYPEKSIYFADQLRFLKKLMLLQHHNERNNPQN